MLPVNPDGLTAYQNTFVSNFLKFYPNPFVLPKSFWDYIVQFWCLDLSKTDSIMRKGYSAFDPEPRLPSCIPRSYKMKPPKGNKKGDKIPCDSSSVTFKLLPLLERWHLKPFFSHLPAL